MDPLSHVGLGFAVIAGIAAARAAHHQLAHVVLKGLPGDVKSLQDECSWLEETLEAVGNAEIDLVIRNKIDSTSKHGLVSTPSDLEILIDRASSRLKDLQHFVDYVVAKAREEDGGDHWQWIRKKNNIDRLRSALRSIRYDLNIQLSNLRPDYFDDSPFLGRRLYSHLISPSLPPHEATFSNRCQRLEESEATIAIWSQFYEECRQAETTSARHQRLVERPTQDMAGPAIATCSTDEVPRSLPFRYLHVVPIEQCLRLYRSFALRLRHIIGSVPPCYILIVLGVCTIVGSLTPALWRSIDRSDISGGFAVAQYILAVGALVLACVLAIHSRTCKCWSSSGSTCSTEPDSRQGALELQSFGQDASSTNGVTAPSP